MIDLVYLCAISLGTVWGRFGVGLGSVWGGSGVWFGIGWGVGVWAVSGYCRIGFVVGFGYGLDALWLVFDRFIFVLKLISITKYTSRICRRERIL